jgi:AraC-like DNA-binding protein
LKEVALKLGYADPSHLSEQLRDWTGYAAKDIRRLLPPAEFVRLLADHLRRADAEEEEDEVEPV